MRIVSMRRRISVGWEWKSKVSQSQRGIVTSCRAVVLPRFGGPEVLEVRPNVEVPDLKPNEVLVRARAVSVNPLDTRCHGAKGKPNAFFGWLHLLLSGKLALAAWQMPWGKGQTQCILWLASFTVEWETGKMRSGYGRSIFEPLLPLILGRDISGEVAALGASVRSLIVGQEVFGALHPTAIRGTYADYAILSEDELAPKPVAITHVEASAIPFAALTAWRAIKSTARISEGQRLLVIGGGGAVGFAAIQLSVAAGCHVTTTCGSQSIDRLLAAGAEQAVDYTAEDLELAIKGNFDAVLDTIGVPETERVGINLLKRGGHYMTLQGEAASLTDRYGLAVGLPLATAVLLKKQIQYRCSHGIEYCWTFMRADSEGLDEIRNLTEAGKLKIPVEKTFPIVQVREAHEAKDKRYIHGKIVLELD
uniref:Enoyl reductase (ER) domain-containing protein n=1 Tax=Quercus lobata TaxID=97700 RepID=A0A7N2R931_QUELO